MNVYYEKTASPFIYMVSDGLSPLPHIHNELEIIYVKNGEAKGYADSNIFSLKTGDIFIAFPNQIHYYETITRGKFYIYLVDPKIIFGLKNQFANFIPKNNVIASTQENRKYFELVLRNSTAQNLTVAVGYMNIILGEIIPKLPLEPNISSDNSTIRSILNYCSENYAEDLSLTRVAEELHLNKYYISHLIKRKLGLGFNDYINILRVRKACHALIETDKKIADISEEIGFGSIRSLNRAFKQQMKMTPLEYRNQEKK